MSVLSYNVAGLPQEVSGENPSEHIPLISPLLDEYDVVMTQEDFDWWVPALDQLDFVHYHDRLRAEATHEHRSGRHPGPEVAGVDPAERPTLSVGDGLGFLSRFPFVSREPLDAAVRQAWTGCFGGFDTADGGAGDCLAMKGFSMVRMALQPGVTVDVYTLHAEAGGTERDQQLQVDDFDQLADYIEQQSEGHAIILGGDTNLHTDSDHPDASDGADTEIWDRFLDRTGLVDTCESLECPETDAIDKIAVRSAGGVQLTATSHDFPTERFQDADGEDLSDHPPLVVEIDWRAEG
jgi:endonuclease/exonuclease/phosphatase family metal-dependent hydrolase